MQFSPFMIYLGFKVSYNLYFYTGTPVINPAKCKIPLLIALIAGDIIILAIPVIHITTNMM